MKIKSIKLIALTLASLIGIAALTPTPVLADDVCGSSASAEVKAAAGCSGTGDQLPITIQNILYAIIGVIGIVAVIFIIIGGVNYMTSQGDASKLQKAKNTILYAVIGLVVCVLAFLIVNFTIGIIRRA